MSLRQLIHVLLVAVERCKIRFSGWQVEVSSACACTIRSRRGQREQASCSLYTGDFKHGCNPSFTQVRMSECELCMMCLSFYGIMMAMQDAVITGP